MTNEPNSHSDYKTLMTNYKSHAAFLHQKGYDSSLAPVKNGWELEITSPNGKTVKVFPRDMLEASRILYSVASVVHAL